jgi:hypothetical protein
MKWRNWKILAGLGTVLLLAVIAFAQIPAGWTLVGTDGLVEGDDGRQNSYAWSMASCMSDDDEYLLVGTYRNFPTFMFNMLDMGDLFGDKFFEGPYDNRAQIILYNTGNPSGGWNKLDLSSVQSDNPAEGVFPDTPDLGPGDGFRKMVEFDGAVYAGTATATGFPKVLAVTDCSEVEVVLNPGVVNGPVDSGGNMQSFRAMTVKEDKLYVAHEKQVYCSGDPLYKFDQEPNLAPETFRWQKLCMDGLTGYITDLAAYHNELYAATGSSECGWKLFKWMPGGVMPELDPALEPADYITVEGYWADVTPEGHHSDKHIAANLFLYKDYLYVGTLNGGFAIYESELPVSAAEEMTPAGFMEDLLKFPYASYLYRFDGDTWEDIVGPFGALSGYGPGFDVPFNVYFWTAKEYDGRLYVGTFDWRSMFYGIDWNAAVGNPTLEQIMSVVFSHWEAFFPGVEVPETPQEAMDIILNHGSPMGFDVFVSEDGVNFLPVTQDGFGNPGSHGARTMAVAGSLPYLWLGTTNMYEGCSVWRHQWVNPPKDFTFSGDNYWVKLTTCPGAEDVSNFLVETDLSNPDPDWPGEVPDNVVFGRISWDGGPVCEAKIVIYFDECDEQAGIWWWDGDDWVVLDGTWVLRTDDPDDDIWDGVDAGFCGALVIELPQPDQAGTGTIEPENANGVILGIGPASTEGFTNPDDQGEGENGGGGGGCSTGSVLPFGLLMLLPLLAVRGKR